MIIDLLKDDTVHMFYANNSDYDEWEKMITILVNRDMRHVVFRNSIYVSVEHYELLAFEGIVPGI